MPRATSKTKPLTFYPPREVAEKVEEIAEAEHRTVSSQLLVFVERGLKEVTNGA